ncbi:hypothetical protein BOX15_Mlig002921g1 [Macrostomum lignano]|uniref:39S ribosomal protein L39, mitochondrial n=2 Tax=Macrostomum lignano TaxID=282301 RepID=A0A267GAG8_9PLAT|nr:hypothetical protein BOX15_Mlig002921g1 [Macrostomum lignano]
MSLPVTLHRQLPTVKKLLLQTQPWRPGSSAVASLATNKEQRQHRLSVFLAEQERQRSTKTAATEAAIEVSTADKLSKSVSLKLNAASTPLDVAKQLDEAAQDGGGGNLVRDSALAVVDEQYYWSMRRPLKKSCLLRFVPLMRGSPASRQEAVDMRAGNNALWRSGAMLLGSVFETAFKEEYRVQLVSSPPPHFSTGSFVYDCRVTKDQALQHSVLQLTGGHCLSAWAPSRAELRALSRTALPLLSADAPFEWLELPLPVALDMFKHNPFKLAAAKRAASASAAAGHSVSGPQRQQQPAALVAVYKVGDFVDLLGQGPLLSRTGQIGSLLFAAVHRIESADYGSLARVQGIAAAAGMSPAEVADWADAALEKASELNSTFPPSEQPQIGAAASKPAAAAAAR